MWETISPDFRKVHEFLSSFTIQAFCDGERVSEYLNFFPIDALCSDVDQRTLTDAAESSSETQPDLERLCRLHFIALTRKPFCTLQFGSGYETAVLADAMGLLQEHFGDWAATLTPNRPVFKIFVHEETAERASAAGAQIDESFASRVEFSSSNIQMARYDERPVSFYDALPDVAPDLIYIGGPTFGAPQGKLGGLSLSAPGRQPMSADMLRLEFFVEPGGLIMMDGRGANARFLRAYLRRQWSYAYEPAADAHFFELNDDPADPQNRKKLDFCIGGDWLLD